MAGIQSSPSPLLTRRLGLALALLGSAIGRGSESPVNLIFVVVDTIRADHRGCYGSVRDSSPAIDTLAAGGIRFDRAYSTAPWTLPAVVSMITDRYPDGQSIGNSIDTSVSSSLSRGQLNSTVPVPKKDGGNFYSAQIHVLKAARVPQ